MMNAAKVNSPSKSSSEERDGVSRAHAHLAHAHLKENDTIPLALKRAVFGRLKNLFFLHFNETF